MRHRARIPSRALSVFSRRGLGNGLESQMKLSRLFCLALISGSVLSVAASAQDNATVSSCPGQPKIPTIFKADCSNVNEPDVKALCGGFIENQACESSPAYRKITGIHLEDLCPVMQYKIYEKENWPLPNRGEGRLAGKCEVLLSGDACTIRHPWWPGFQRRQCSAIAPGASRGVPSSSQGCYRRSRPFRGHLPRPKSSGANRLQC